MSLAHPEPPRHLDMRTLLEHAEAQHLGFAAYGEGARQVRKVRNELAELARRD